jgi:signal peptidase I
MAPAIQPYDYILVPKFLYGLHLPLRNSPLVEWGSPARGDVVVFKSTDESTYDASSTPTMVKRVIALEGDTVEIVEGQVYLNSIPLFEPYAKGSLPAAEGYHFGPFKVPDGKIFVLGDNRANSEDSRSWRDPFVPVSQVLGRAILVYWSSARRDRSGTVL